MVHNRLAFPQKPLLAGVSRAAGIRRGRQSPQNAPGLFGRDCSATICSGHLCLGWAVITNSTAVGAAAAAVGAAAAALD